MNACTSRFGRNSRAQGWSSAAARGRVANLTAYWTGPAARRGRQQSREDRNGLRSGCVSGLRAVSPDSGMIGRPTFRAHGLPSGVDLVILSGTTAATLDGTPGLPDSLPGRRSRKAGTCTPPGYSACRQMAGWPEHLSLVTFDASVAKDLERVMWRSRGCLLGHIHVQDS